MCSRSVLLSRLLTAAVILFIIAAPASAAWLVPDWAGREPQFPPGSWLWQTGKYPTCPIVYRTVVEVRDKPLAFAAFRAKAHTFAYVFLNGELISEYYPQRETSPAERLDVELTTLLKPGRNVLVISTAQGFSLKGAVKYADGAAASFTDDPASWKVQKLPPLTMLEYEPCMKPDFDDSGWFNLKPSDEEAVDISVAGLETVAASLETQRLRSLDEDAKWRLRMLAQKGIAVVDWTAYGWAGPNRLETWLLDLARIDPNAPAEPGSVHNRAEALASCVRLADEKVNLQNYVTGLKALNAPAEQIEACQNAADALEKTVSEMTAQIHAGKYADAAAAATKGQKALADARKNRVINDLCSCLDNKFGWFETNAILESRPADWGLDVNCPADVLSSPLSPASLITLKGKELVLTGWETLEPGRIYERKTPNTGPVCLWAKIAGKVTSLPPPRDGENAATVYDRAANGPLEENWVLLVHDLTAGGPLPIQLVFLAEPDKITFEPGQKGTRKVTVAFDAPGARLFALRPLREWRGYMQMARDLTESPLRLDPVAEYIEQCRLWSRSLLHYPVTFSEVFLPDPDNKRSILVADVYNYLRFEDSWKTTPQTIAPLPPLATFGLLTNYPGLDVISSAQKLGSNAKWGDNIAAVDADHIVYRVPIDPIKRFGGFTSYCFGGTDIGEPGGHLEIKAVALSGCNSYRPQHNQTGRRAIQTIDWCQEFGLQNCFNADEKWVPDVVAHYRTLAEECKDYPPDAVAYDLLNEPETRLAVDYDALIRKVTNAIRAIDKTHLIYVEAFPPWAPGAKPFPQGAFEQLKLTGDPLTCCSFHDYEFRLPPRWPNDKNDITSLLDRWVPVFRYSVENRVPIHLGEFGAFEQTKNSPFDNKCTITLLNDYLKIFDHFGWHFHYYSNRGVTRVKRDGTLGESLVQQTYRQYFKKGTFNINH